MPGELLNRFSWSHSRHETFQVCPRRYYYHYYGSWNGWRSDADPAARRLYLLKQLKPRHLWAGGLVHDAIAGVLRPLREERAQQALPQADLRERTIGAAIERMRAEFRASRAGAYLRSPGRAPGLSEHHYALEVSDAQWRELADGVREALANFFAGPYWDEFSRLERGDWLALEDLDEFALEGTPVYVKLDVARREPGDGAAVIDWKTGRRPPSPEGFQFGIYALHATLRWALPPERIRVRVVHLNGAREISSVMDAERLAETRRSILASVAAMRERLQDPASNAAAIEDFPARVAERHCRDCAFREVCPEARESYPARATGGAGASLIGTGDDPRMPA